MVSGEPAHVEAERTARFLVERAQRRFGTRWSQGSHRPGLLDGAADSASVGPFVRTVATTRIARLSLPAARALIAWASGRARAHLFERVLLPSEVLELQASGQRCVSLLPDDAPTGRHEDASAFAEHDLCHLEKFIDPQHHHEQVGFFQHALAATRHGRWKDFCAAFDGTWQTDWDYVVCDMNGSSVFLFAAAKMKLKMAVRRKLVRDKALTHEAIGKSQGPLDETEARAFDAAFVELLTLLDLPSTLAPAARAISTRHEAADSAWELVRHFEAVARDQSRCATRIE
jgi:hypothetical protein